MMIVKKLKLENIRSYKEAVVDFPLGRTLFEGNIGCGKSTILMAIEFALFGLGSEKGGSLLRAGEKSGSVSLVFECDGVEYVARRKLKRERNSVQQDKKCELKSPEGVISYTPGELKEKILEILDFNEPVDPKAQSVIYHYAVYTPQEEMKAILNLKPDVRMQTLRKAFRIEDYKTAGEHARSLQSGIRNKAKILQSLSDTKEDLVKLENNKKMITAIEAELGFLRKQELENNSLLEDLMSKREELTAAQLALTQSVGRLQGLEELLKNKRHEAERAEKQARAFRGKIDQLEPQIQQLEQVRDPSEKTLKQLKNVIAEIERRYRQLVEEKTSIQVKVDEYGSILEEGICPTCDRVANAEEFSPKIETRKKELDAANKASEDCSRLLEELRDLFESKRDFEANLTTLAGYRNNLDEYRKNETLWSTQVSEAKTAIESANNQLSSVGADLAKLKQITKGVDRLKEEIQTAESTRVEIARKISSENSTIENLKRQNGELDQEIKRKSELKLKAAKLDDYQVWIQDYFTPTLEIIEQQVMIRIKEDFDWQFQKWFGMLVDDPGKEARIDEEFTPLIQQDGMDQDVMYLSGGEKTSVALAYRLALNNIVGKVAAGAKSNLLILDEPTDGFSKEQLGKVREILDEIKNPQVILVSHETELESFADQVLRISKKNGESAIASYIV